MLGYRYSFQQKKKKYIIDNGYLIQKLIINIFNYY